MRKCSADLESGNSEQQSAASNETYNAWAFVPRRYLLLVKYTAGTDRKGYE